MLNITEIKELVLEYAWLEPAIGIFVLLISGFLACWRWLVPWLKREKLDSVVPKEFVGSWNIEFAKRVARIAIVDDQPKDFPVQELKADGFNVVVHKQVSLADVKALGEYDIVFLDMKGIVKDDPEYGGLRLIADLRAESPHQKVCAVSSKTFDPTATEFFKLADNCKKKPMTAQECKAVISSFLEAIFDPSSALTSANAVLASLSVNQKVAVVQRVKLSIARKESAQILSNELSKLGLRDEDVRKLRLLYRMISYEAK